MTFSNSSSVGRAAPPLVSVIMPTHDRPAELRIAIQSVLEQSHENWELIVVNDGGGDVSSVISLANDSSRIHYIHLARSRGAAAARNVGLSLAQGEYVTYLDDDDWYDAQHLRVLVQQLEQSNASVAYTDSRRVVEQRDQTRPGKPYVPCGVQEPYHSTPFSRDGFLVNNYIPILCVMHRRDCLDAVGMFDENLPVLEDWELWIRMSRRFDFVHIPEVTCSVRWRTDGTTTTTKRRREHWLAAKVIQDRYASEVAGRQDLLQAQATLLASLKAGSEAHPPRCSLLVAFDSHTLHLRQVIEAAVLGSRGFACELVLAGCGDIAEHQIWLESLSGDVQILRLEAATSVARAWQEAAARARGEYIVLLPSDAIVRPGWMDHLVGPAEGGASIVGAKLLDADGRVRRAGGSFRPATCQFEAADEGAAPWRDDLRGCRTVEALGAQPILMKRMLFEKLGGLRVDLEPDAAIAELSARCGGRVVLAGQSVAYQARTSTGHGEKRSVVPPATCESQPLIDVGGLRKRAGEALKAEDLSTAEALLLDIESAEPDDAESWVIWGVLHMQRGEFAEAERRFRGVAERGGDEIKGGTGVAIALGGMGKTEEAWDHLQPLADRFPNEADILHAVFRTGVALGKFDGLRERLEPYVDGSPEDDDMRFALATVCVRLGDAKAASHHYTRLQQRAPDYAGLDELAARLTGAGHTPERGRSLG